MLTPLWFKLMTSPEKKQTEILNADCKSDTFEEPNKSSAV